MNKDMKRKKQNLRESIAGYPMYNTKQLAELMKISDNTVRKYIVAGRMKGRRIGRMYWVHEEELKRFLGVN